MKRAFQKLANKLGYHIIKLPSSGAAEYLSRIDAIRSDSQKSPPRLIVTRASSQEEFQTHLERIGSDIAGRRELDRKLVKETPSFQTPGFCFVCGKWTYFSSSWMHSHEKSGARHFMNDDSPSFRTAIQAHAGENDGVRHVNWRQHWREHLQCPGCGLNSRMRAAIHLLAETVSLPESPRIYMAEQVTRLHTVVLERHPLTVGSEYLGDTVPFGQTNAAGVRNEDATKLTFPDGVFDALLTFEVLEHIPSFRDAFAECARVLKPGGKMLFSAPFDVNSKTNIIRARVKADGSIEHLLPPEYHGDPLNPAGCLCFQHFGWEMLDQVKEAGFSSVSALSYHSAEYGYLGEQIQFLACK